MRSEQDPSGRSCWRWPQARVRTPRSSPSHAAERPLTGMLFAASALALAGVSVMVDRGERRDVVVAAVGLLGALIALYVASRMVVVWPLSHVEAVDAVGVVTKLFEAAGLLLALSLLRIPSASGETLRAVREGAGR